MLRIPFFLNLRRPSPDPKMLILRLGSLHYTFRVSCPSIVVFLCRITTKHQRAIYPPPPAPSRPGISIYCRRALANYPHCDVASPRCLYLINDVTSDDTAGSGRCVTSFWRWTVGRYTRTRWCWRLPAPTSEPCSQVSAERSCSFAAAGRRKTM